MRTRTILALVLAGLLLPAAGRANVVWERLPGKAVDISVGANGATWVVGTGGGAGGHAVYHWNHRGKWTETAARAVRVAVDPEGGAWLINDQNRIFSHDGRKWHLLPGTGTDIGIGADGTVWLISANRVSGGYGIHRWTGTGWTASIGGAGRIAVGPKGRPWVVNEGGHIFHHDGRRWHQMPGVGKDIGVGADGTVWVTAPDDAIYRWTGRHWQRHKGRLASITVAPNGLALGVNRKVRIYRARGALMAPPPKRMPKGLFAAKYYRNGPGVRLPRCDKWTDTVARAATRAVNYVGSRTVDTARALDGVVRKGDFNGLKTAFNRHWRDLKTAAGAAGTVVAHASPVSLAYVVAELLPDNKATAFLNKARKFHRDVTSRMAASSLDTLEKDFKEISRDSWGALKNIKDPAALGRELGRLTQKWNPTVSWSYMVTEGDPLTGMKRTAAAFKRQVDIVTTYGSGSIARNLLESSAQSYILEQADGVIRGMRLTPDERKAYLAMVAGTMLELSRLRTRAKPAGGQRFAVEMFPAELVYNDKGSGGRSSWALWRARIPTNRDCVAIGDQAVLGYGSVRTVGAVCGAGRAPGTWWTFPTGYALVWSDRCSGARMNGSIWKPVCPAGYVSPGFVAHDHAGLSAPAPARIACLKRDPALINVVPGRAAGMRWLANDRKSGAKLDLNLYARRFGALSLMVALPTYDERLIDSIALPVPAN